MNNINTNSKRNNNSKRNTGNMSLLDNPKVGEILGSKIPPHSDDAEKALLGAMIIDKTAISKSLELIDSDSFYHERHRLIFDTIISLYERGISVDLLTLSEELNKRKILDKIGGTYYLAELNDATPTSANAEFHARIVQEKFIKRSLINAAGNILVNNYDESTDALEEVDRAESQIFEIAEKRFARSFVDLNTLTHQTIEYINQLVERDIKSYTGVPSGFRDLDELLGGFQNSDFIVIAARPSMGKTALALSIARNAAVDANIPVAFFSIEMSDMQLVIRLISAETKVNSHKIRTGKISQKDLSVIVKKIGKLAKAPMFIDDSPALSITELRAKCRRLKAEHNIRLILVDYLQLIHPPKAESREREISIISSSLKQIAKELNIPVIALAQLNRGVESRADKRPMLSDLRESGSIEQDADVVIFIYRPEHYGIKTYDDQIPTENTAEIIIGKQRNGPIGSVRLYFDKDLTRFENLDTTRRNDIPPETNDSYYFDDEIEEEPF